MSYNNQNSDSSPATAIAVTSGKGGVGKTSLATNLAIALRRSGQSVCLIDADIGLANVNILLGLQPTTTIEDVIRGQARLAEALLENADGLQIVPAAADLSRLDGTDPRLVQLAGELAELERRFDYLLVDTPAGVGQSTLDFVCACAHAVIAITQEPTSLTDAFSLLKALKRRAYTGQLSIVVNMLPHDRDGERLFARFSVAAWRYLSLELGYLGHINMDGAVTRAVLLQRPLLTSAPKAPAATSISDIAANLQRKAPAGQGDFASYWRERASAPPPTAVATRPGEHGGPGVITPPRSHRDAAHNTGDNDDSTEHTAPQLAEALARRFGDSDVEETQARQWLRTVDTAFTRRFRRNTNDLKSLIYRVMMNGTLSRVEQRSLLETMIAAYYRRYPGQSPDPDLTLPDDAVTDEQLTRCLQRRQATLTQLRSQLERLEQEDAALSTLLQPKGDQ